MAALINKTNPTKKCRKSLGFCLPTCEIKRRTKEQVLSRQVCTGNSSICVRTCYFGDDLFCCTFVLLGKRPQKRSSSSQVKHPEGLNSVDCNTHFLITVGLNISPTNTDPQWSPIYKVFYRIRFCRSEQIGQ